jgi:glutamate racemase
MNPISEIQPSFIVSPDIANPDTSLADNLPLCNPAASSLIDPFFLKKEKYRARIGVFDSGVGGLTVLREVYRQMPNEPVLYFGDTDRLPYGTRSASEILQYVREVLTWLETQHVKMVILACNTSSAIALDSVRTEFPFPILGLILPGAMSAVQKGKRIGVIATPATVASQAYPRAIAESAPMAQVWQVACPKFVPLIEQNRVYDPITYKIAQDYLNPLIEHQIDTLIYGCTHYPHLAPVIRSIVPASVQLIDPAAHVVAAAARELKLLGLCSNRPLLPTRFCVTGCPQQFSDRATPWLGCIPMVEKVQVSAKTCSPSPLDATD